MLQTAIDIYAEIVKAALPFAIGFEICNLLVSTFLRVAFGGRLWFGSH